MSASVIQKYILLKGNSYVGQRLADADDDIVAAVWIYLLAWPGLILNAKSTWFSGDKQAEWSAGRGCEAADQRAAAEAEQHQAATAARWSTSSSRRQPTARWPAATCQLHQGKRLELWGAGVGRVQQQGHGCQQQRVCQQGCKYVQQGPAWPLHQCHSTPIFSTIYNYSHNHGSGNQCNINPNAMNSQMWYKVRRY